MRMRSAIVARKIKFARVSKPKKLAKAERGSGNMATRRKTIGSRSQAIEFLTDMLFLAREIIMMMKSSSAAIDISICIPVMFPP